MLLDIQGSSFKLYDPEIATADLLANDVSLGSKEVNFCAGSLSCVTIDSFKWKHICNIYCDMMSLEQVIKIALLANDASIDAKEVNFYAGNLSYICNWFI